ncbi:MAG: response regulator [Acidobacteria bacterium]|nr:response regulator [Acidobacteriota bacterium]
MRSLRKLGDLQMECVSSVEAALAAIDRSLPKLILLDIKLQGKRDGIQLAEIIHQHHDIPVVFITAFCDTDTMRRAQRTRPFRILGKIGDGGEVVRTVAEILSAGYGISLNPGEMHG